MRENVKKILLHEIQEIIKSPELSMLLLSTYSKLYLNGGQPRSCERSQREYFNEIKKTGMEKAGKKKTCVAKWNGNKYVASMASHLNSGNITDDQAIKALVGGHLKESDFLELPEDYKKKPAKKKTKSKKPKKVADE